MGVTGTADAATAATIAFILKDGSATLGSLASTTFVQALLMVICVSGGSLLTLINDVGRE